MATSDCSTHYVILTIFLSSALSWNYCNSLCNSFEEACFFLRAADTRMPQLDEYGVYETRKSECALIRHKAATYPIPMAGALATGVAKLPYTHEILDAKPYKSRRASVYNVSCPQGYLSYFILLSLDLDQTSCSDYLRVITPLDDAVTICGCDTNATSKPIIGNITQLFFRSDNRNSAGNRGFTAIMQCFRPEDSNLEGCSNGSDDLLEKWVLGGSGVRESDSASPTDHLPRGEATAVLSNLSNAVFDVVARNLNRQIIIPADNATSEANFSDVDIETAISHMRSCSGVLRATARVILNYTNMSQPGRIDRIYRSKFTPPTPTPPATNSTESYTTSQVPFGPRCIDTMAIPICSQIGYATAHFPNLRKHQSPEEARTELADFLPLVRGVCSNAIAHLLCSVYAPFCSEQDDEEPVMLYPCVEMCQYVRSGCIHMVESYGMKWPAQLNCEDTDIYKPRNSSEDLIYCPTDLEAVTLPNNLTPPTTTPDPIGMTNTTANAITTPADALTTPVPTTGTTLTTDETTVEAPTSPGNQILTIATQTQSNSRCESISTVPICSHIGYQQAFFPSFRHGSASGANSELANFKPLIDSNCSELLLHLLCSVNAPLCYMDRSNQPNRIQPCVELCLHVKHSCEHVLRTHGVPWPAHLDCTNSEIYRSNDSFSYCPSTLPSNMSTVQVTPTSQTPATVMPMTNPTPYSSGREDKYTCSAHQIPVCSSLKRVGWGNVSFPNFRGHKTQEAAGRELLDFKSLIQVECSNALVHFLCSIYAPYCDSDYPQLRLRPCKELCQHVRGQCEDNLMAFGYSWPSHFDCDNSELFPAQSSGVVNFCPNNIEGLVFPPLPPYWSHYTRV